MNSSIPQFPLQLVWTALALLISALLTPAESLAQSACSSAGYTITRVSSPIIYIDTGITPPLTGYYSGYKIDNASGGNVTDLWVKATNFTVSGKISLPTTENGERHSGPLNNGATKYAYFYFQASAATTSTESHDIVLYAGKPGVGTAICKTSFSATAEETIKANANKVTAAFANPDPPEASGQATLTVTGETGTMVGGQFHANPAALADAAPLANRWRADAFELTGVKIEMTGGNTLTSNHFLSLTGLNRANTSYTVTYYFRVVGVTSTNTTVWPVNYISSGGNIKHTNTADYATDLQPISPVSNFIRITSKSALHLLFSPAARQLTL
ncbi:MAG TPA: hypothetical protein PKD37_00390 [Oligoflexia bacterium]|nr:hypothetical protein [Oligoflexia bacterium]HMP26439.1 hypothetical protein [Oligoflexia bacterium]